METLGQVLKSTREGVSLTLRQVEESTGNRMHISVNWKMIRSKKPSASVLYKLSEVYKINLNIFVDCCWYYPDK